MFKGEKKNLRYEGKEEIKSYTEYETTKGLITARDRRQRSGSDGVG